MVMNLEMGCEVGRPQPKKDSHQQVIDSSTPKRLIFMIKGSDHSAGNLFSKTFY
jgi:hypothetical protein